MTTYHCPLCGLRFSWTSELDEHAREEHAPHDLVVVQEHITAYKAPKVRTDAGVPART
ncbi:MAG: hypothetical protein Q8R60_19455 [Mycobacteriales bacterium]|nr:hypothetical protein [Mycobacteriales bacterium]